MHKICSTTIFALRVNLIFVIILARGLQGQVAGAGTDRFAAVRQVHSRASEEVIRDEKLLAKKVPDDLKIQFEAATGRQITQNPTYAEALRETEDILKSTVQVSVKVTAFPNHCPVKFRAIAGGPQLDFGATDVTRTVDPRTYEFVCVCTEKNRPKKIVDCTEDRTVPFECKNQ